MEGRTDEGSGTEHYGHVFTTKEEAKSWSKKAATEFIQSRADPHNLGWWRAPHVDETISRGTRVELHSLQNAQELNGQSGVAERWNAQQGRWQVRLDGDPKCRGLRADNLKKSDDIIEVQSAMGKICFKFAGIPVFPGVYDGIVALIDLQTTASLAVVVRDRVVVPSRLLEPRRTKQVDRLCAFWANDSEL